MSAKIILPANSRGKSLKVTGPADIVAPNATWKIREGVSVFLDVESEVEGQAWGWRMTLADRDTHTVWPKDNKIWTVCSGCGAVARGHVVEKHCDGAEPRYGTGDDAQSAVRTVCPGDPSCRCAPIKAWLMVSGHLRVLNSSRQELAVMMKQGDRRCRWLLGPGEMTDALEGFDHEVEITSSEDTSPMYGQVVITGGMSHGVIKELVHVIEEERINVAVRSGLINLAELPDTEVARKAWDDLTKPGNLEAIKSYVESFSRGMNPSAWKFFGAAAEECRRRKADEPKGDDA